MKDYYYFLGIKPNASSEDIKKAVDEAKKKIIDGQLFVFTGPIKDQNGQVRIEAGQKMSDADMLKFDWFVEGVDGTIAK